MNSNILFCMKFICFNAAIMASMNFAHASPMPFVVPPPSCEVILHGKQQLNNPEAQVNVKQFFLALQDAVERKDKDSFLSLVNFSGVTDDEKADINNFIQEYFKATPSAVSGDIVIECLNGNQTENEDLINVTIQPNGQQIFKNNGDELNTYRTNHPAFYFVNFIWNREYDDTGFLVGVYNYGIWAGPHNDKIMFTIATPYTPEAD